MTLWKCIDEPLLLVHLKKHTPSKIDQIPTVGVFYFRVLYENSFRDKLPLKFIIDFYEHSFEIYSMWNIIHFKKLLRINVITSYDGRKIVFIVFRVVLLAGLSTVLKCLSKWLYFLVNNTWYMTFFPSYYWLNYSTKNEGRFTPHLLCIFTFFSLEIVPITPWSHDIHIWQFLFFCRISFIKNRYF